MAAVNLRDGPVALRLIKRDTGTVIGPEMLKWEFGLALAAYRAQLDQGTSA
jgi:hypothetical protein